MKRKAHEQKYMAVPKASDAKLTEQNLNLMYEKGYKVVCSYSYGNWFILEKKEGERNDEKEEKTEA